MGFILSCIIYVSFQISTSVNRATAAVNIIVSTHMAPIIARVRMASSCIRTNADATVNVPIFQPNYISLYIKFSQQGAYLAVCQIPYAHIEIKIFKDWNILETFVSTTGILMPRNLRRHAINNHGINDVRYVRPPLTFFQQCQQMCWVVGTVKLSLIFYRLIRNGSVGLYVAILPSREWDLEIPGSSTGHQRETTFSIRNAFPV